MFFLHLQYTVCTIIHLEIILLYSYPYLSIHLIHPGILNHPHNSYSFTHLTPTHLHSLSNTRLET